ncbi:C-type lectin 37Da-like [Drosophila subobscura]|uniref:C-type lectin 37Da-like n=1 Tax=Drosophila subobscura TaxID=7241 RepID=UPI00155B2D2E|nr:C-type lectin 37Da-like [Drosophila subobscura]
MSANFTLFLTALGLFSVSLTGAYNIASHVADGVPAHLNITIAPFVQIGDGYYLIEQKVLKNWYQAHLECRKLGADLVSFETRKEMEAVHAHPSITGERLQFWTSGTDLAEQGEHVWFANSKPLSKDFWFPGEPNNSGGNERCVTLWYKFSDSPGLNDLPCERLHRYICEAPTPKTASFVIW